MMFFYKNSDKSSFEEQAFPGARLHTTRPPPHQDPDQDKQLDENEWMDGWINKGMDGYLHAWVDG